MEDLTLEDFKESFQSLLEISRCVLCLETVRPTLVQCMRGHAVCAACAVGIHKCPTCRDLFSTVKPYMLSQIVEKMPRKCKHKNCPKLVKFLNEHEKYCCWKLTACKYCKWIGPAKDLLEHVKLYHTAAKIFTESNFPDSWPNFFPEVAKTAIALYLVKGQLFWEVLQNDPQTNMLTITLYSITNGKPEQDFYYEVQFTSSKSKFMSKFKLNLDSEKAYEEQENVIYIPKFMLQDFVTEEKRLKGKVYISTT